MAGIASVPKKNRIGNNASIQRESLFVAEPPLGDDSRPVIQKLLIANRGEIACRIIQTCRKLNIVSVAVYVDEDASSRHVKDAGESINIGSIDRSNGNPFLNIDLLVEMALKVGAQAIHPGYGYLSENADFANRVREAGLIFVGPSASAMSTLGDKRSSKVYLRRHAPDVPLIPGFGGTSEDIQGLRKAAEEIGYPVMLKASAGGGGKGMRIVQEPGQLEYELERAQSESRRSFGSSDCILEKYIESSKHVEIQILGDSQGHIVSFFDRDCSVQRRHQKIIEEAPCPFLTEETRRLMSATAVRIAKLIGYENAGTVEFVVDVKTRRFYFLEVNARLQVEHPITEEVTGVDLVSLQLFVAAGGSLQTLPAVKELTQHGHAIECRLCAEDPQKNFFPEHGKVHLWLTAADGLGPGRDIRYETAIQTGSSVSIYFDSMIAKVVVWAPTRALAIEKMVKVLAHTVCMGVKTNQLFLQRCLVNAAFRDPAFTTSFISSNLEELLRTPFLPNTSNMENLVSLIPSLVFRRFFDYAYGASHQRPFKNVRKRFRNQRFDPVNIHCDIVTMSAGSHPPAHGTISQSQLMCLWKPEAAGTSADLEEVSIFSVPEHKSLEDEPTPTTTAATAQYNAISKALRGDLGMATGTYRVGINSWHPAQGNPAVPGSWLASTIEVWVNGSKMLAHVAIPSAQPHTLPGLINRSRRIYCHFPSIGTHFEFRLDSLLSFAESIRTNAKAQNGTGQKVVTAPMPCKVLSILKKNGDEVESGNAVIVIESMKMEVNIRAPATGKFQTTWKQGDAVEEGKVLCSIV